MTNDKNTKPNTLPSEAPVANKGALIDSANTIMVLNVITKNGKEETKKTYKLHKKRIVIGSALSSDIRIQQNSVSNVHAVVEMSESGVAHIYDMASETGIFINDKKTVSQDIKDGDEIKIGFALIAFSLKPLVEAQAAIPSASIRKSGERNLFLNEKEDFRPLILEDERNVIEIFDYSKSSVQALQVAMYWGDAILNIRHFVDKSEIVIGENEKADFLVPGLPTDFPLVSMEGNEYVIRITEDMRGAVRTKQRMLSLDELRKEKQAGSGAFTFTLKTNDLAKLEIKGITLFLSFSPAPPLLKSQRILERDPVFTKIWFTSLATTLFLVFLAMKMEKPIPLEVDELPPRVATIIFKPMPEVEKPRVAVEKVEKKEEEKPVDKLPKEVKKPVQKLAENSGNSTKPKGKTTPDKAKGGTKGASNKVAGGNKGEGARAAGEEGKKGKPTAAPDKVAQEASRGNPNAKTPAKTQAQGTGSVESLTGDLGGAISKSLAAGGQGATAAMGRLRGYGGFTTQGNGGLGAVGTGSGGGGKSLDVSGLGTKGLGEGSSGKGLGAIGEGGNILGTGRGRPVVEVGGAQDTVIVGGLDKNVIDEIIKRHINQIRHCYEQEARGASSDLRGRIGTRFVISATGRVSQAGVESSTMNNPNVERCLVGVIQHIIFPEPLGGGIVEVAYPFVFSPAFTSR